MPLTNTFFIAALPPADAAALTDAAAEPETAQPPSADAAAENASAPSPGWSWASEPASVVLIDMDRTHPIMRFMEVFSLLIFNGRAISGPPGSTELIGADIGPMLVIAPRGGYQDMVLGFEIISSDVGGVAETNTNWYAERSWPVFVLNVLRYLAGAAESSGAPSYPPGQTVQLRLESAITDATFRRVGGNAKPLSPGPSGLAEILDTESPGNYRVEAEDQLADLFSVNLFQRSESDLTVAPSVELGYESVKAATGGVEVRVEYWRFVLLAMLMMLVTEWWLYSRRVA